MKKSMLLSTIAMIVVVVVALSTATFAWFSSFNEVTATATLEIKATDNGLEIRELNEEGNAWAAWTNTVSMTADSLTAVAPKADLQAPTYTGYTGAAIPDATTVKFFDAQQDATNVWVTNAQAADNTYIYKEFQVRSTAAAKKKVTLTAEIKKNGTETITDATKETIKNTKIVIVSTVGGGAANTAQWVGTKFNYGLNSDGTIPEVGSATSNTVAKGEATGKATEQAAKLLVNAASNNESINATDTWTLTGTNPDQYITVRVWIWIDGHTADNTAKGGKVDVALKFKAENAPEEVSP